MSINFVLRSSGRRYSISLPTAMMPFTNGQYGEMVVSSALRSAGYSRYVSVPMMGAELRMEDEFKADFQLVLDAFNSTGMPLTAAVMKQVLLRVCGNHVKQYGRIWIADAMMYVDCAIFMMKAVDNLSDARCAAIYSDLADHVVSAMGDALKRPNPFGF